MGWAPGEGVDEGVKSIVIEVAVQAIFNAINRAFAGSGHVDHADNFSGIGYDDANVAPDPKRSGGSHVASMFARCSVLFSP